jgi:rod shape-determining protein MreC
MAVVTPEGIVGKVLAAYPTASQVQLITDGTFAAGVISQKNRVYGTLKGTGQSKCIVDYVQNEEKVEQGEMFFTSGDDRVFPKGMPVGTVTVVKPGKGFKEITVVPTAFQQGLEEVLVVLEGVHQSIPDKSVTPSTPVKILPPPPPEGGQVISQQPGGGAPAGAAGTPAAGTPAGSGTDLRSGLSTTADRLKDRYKRIGEMQNHTFGEGLPGSKPPDFTLNPDAPKAKPQAPAASAGAPAAGGAATGGATPTGQPTTAPVKQPPPTAGQTTPAKPQGAPSTAPGETPAPTAAKPQAPKAATPPTGTSVTAPTPAPDAPKPQATPPPSAKPKPATPADSTASPPSGERNRAAPVQPAPQSAKPKPRQQPPESLPFP